MSRIYRASNTPRACFPNVPLLRIEGDKKKVPASDIPPTPKEVDSKNETEDYEASSEKTISNVVLYALLIIVGIAFAMAYYGWSGWQESMTTISNQNAELTELRSNFATLQADNAELRGNFATLQADNTACGNDYVKNNNAFMNHVANSTLFINEYAKVIKNLEIDLGKNMEIIKGLHVDRTSCWINAVHMVAENLPKAYRTKTCPSGFKAYVQASAGFANKHTGCEDKTGFGTSAIAATAANAGEVYCLLPWLPKEFSCNPNYYVENKVEGADATAEHNGPASTDKPNDAKTTVNFGAHTQAGSVSAGNSQQSKNCAGSVICLFW